MNLFPKHKESHWQKKKSIVTEGEGWVGGGWDLHLHTTVYKIVNQQGPTVYHRELYAMKFNNI